VPRWVVSYNMPRPPPETTIAVTGHRTQRPALLSFAVHGPEQTDANSILLGLALLAGAVALPCRSLLKPLRVEAEGEHIFHSSNRRSSRRCATPSSKPAQASSLGTAYSYGLQDAPGSAGCGSLVRAPISLTIPCLAFADGFRRAPPALPSARQSGPPYALRCASGTVETNWRIFGFVNDAHVGVLLNKLLRESAVWLVMQTWRFAAQLFFLRPCIIFVILIRLLARASVFRAYQSLHASERCWASGSS